MTGGLVLPWCNTEGMSLYLAEIAARVTPGKQYMLLVNQPGWHTTDRLVMQTNITIVALFANCPELNPVEDVWQFMRYTSPSNQVLGSYDANVDHCCGAWNKPADQPWCVMTNELRDRAHGLLSSRVVSTPPSWPVNWPPLTLQGSQKKSSSSTGSPRPSDRSRSQLVSRCAASGHRSRSRSRNKATQCARKALSAFANSGPWRSSAAASPSTKVYSS